MHMRYTCDLPGIYLHASSKLHQPNTLGSPIPNLWFFHLHPSTVTPSIQAVSSNQIATKSLHCFAFVPCARATARSQVIPNIQISQARQSLLPQCNCFRNCLHENRSWDCCCIALIHATSPVTLPYCMQQPVATYCYWYCCQIAAQSAETHGVRARGAASRRWAQSPAYWHSDTALD